MKLEELKIHCAVRELIREEGPTNNKFLKNTVGEGICRIS